MASRSDDGPKPEPAKTPDPAAKPDDDEKIAIETPLEDGDPNAQPV